VTGHVDGVGLLTKSRNHGNWSQIWIRVAEKLTRQMASKGSVAVDGISLTLVDVDREEFSVALIPHTLEVTNLGQRAIGDQLNVETDVLAKYVERQLLENPALRRRSPEHEAS
jgi:riboflavin synthase